MSKMYQLLHIHCPLINMDFYFRFGRVPTDFRMDDVDCSGNETSILDCPHITNDNCGAGEGAGVVCIGKDTNMFQ